MHRVKSVQMRSFYTTYFLAFGLNTEIYGVSLNIHSEYMTRQNGRVKTPYLDTFQALMLISASTTINDAPLHIGIN